MKAPAAALFLVLVPAVPLPAAAHPGGGDIAPEIADVAVLLDTSVGPGDVAEGCASSTGPVDLLRFSTRTWNLGSEDLHLGAPGCPEPCDDHPLESCTDPNFICSPAQGHNHPHFQNFADYELLDGSGTQVVAVGHKQSACLRDTICPVKKYACDNQGISAGCADVYGASLGCQYVEITGVPGGEYVLRVTLDPGGRIEETDETNNVATVRVVIPSRPGETPLATPTSTPPSPATPTATEAATETPTPEPPATDTPTPGCTTCPGDCNCDGSITVDELVRAVNTGLGLAGVAECATADGNGDGEVTVDEMVRAVNGALSGCGG